MEDVKRETSDELSLTSVFPPPPEFQSSPLDLPPDIQTFENHRTKSPEPQKDLFQTFTHSQAPDLFQTSVFPQSAPLDVSLDSPDAFKGAPSRALNPFGTLPSNQNDLLRSSEGDGLFQAGKADHLFRATSTKEMDFFHTSSSDFLDPFHSPSNKGEDLFQSPRSKEGNPFHTPSTKEVDLFQALSKRGGDLFQAPLTNDPFDTPSMGKGDIFSSSFTKTDDPFMSSYTKNQFQHSPNTSEPSQNTPLKAYDLFQGPSNGTSDIFPPIPLKTQNGYSPFPAANSSDIFNIPPSNTPSTTTYSVSSFNSTTETKSDIFSPFSVEKSPDPFQATPSEPHPAIHPNSSGRPRDIIFTTPLGSKHDILQPTPFSLARNLASSPSQTPTETTHATTFKRPPKPLPRTKPPRLTNPPRKTVNPPELKSPKTPPKPPPKPVLRSTQAAQVDRQEEVESDVFENILLIGQERCVEDWPEDSPQLDPDFKPSGKLRLRRESMKVKADCDGGSGEDQDGSGSHGKKKGKKFKVSLLSRRGSKEKHEFKDACDNNTLPRRSKDGFPETQFLSAGENEGEEENDVDCKPRKPLKTKVSQLLRRASVASSVRDNAEDQTKRMNGLLTQGLKDDDDVCKQKVCRNSSAPRRWSEGTALHDGFEEEEDEEEEEEDDGHKEAGNHGFKRRKRVKIKFLPRRGFAISIEKTDDELKGAHGYTPRSGSKAAFMEDECCHKGVDPVSSGVGDEDHHETEDCRPKKPIMKLPHLGRRTSKDDMLGDNGPQKSSVSAGEMEDEEQKEMDNCKLKKQSKHKGPVVSRRKSKTTHNNLRDSSHTRSNHHAHPSHGSFLQDDIPPKGADLFSARELYKDDQDEIEDYKLKKPSKLKGLKKHKAKSKAMGLEHENPPGATSSDYYLSEAAEAEWLAAQLDERLDAGLEEGDEEGDTDSLMEWWYTVEQWDEVPSDEEDKAMKEDETKSFTTLAGKVHRGLRVFNKVFTERAEVLWQSVIALHAIADDISKFHKKAKIANITGGTTTAVGGVAAIAGLALAPITFGASLIITAVGVGVATAGGITSASAAISDNVNNMHDRKKVEIVLQDYEKHLLDIGKILHFVDQGIYRLRGHPLLRAGTQHYSEDWEIRRAVQMISFVDRPVMRASEITDDAVVSVQGLFKGIDKYFMKDSRELKKGCKKEVVYQIKELANVLNDGLVELNAIREELQDANGNL
ncbi:uncharacterized protein ACJ7VT_012293 [Polymixia lowei]